MINNLIIFFFFFCLYIIFIFYIFIHNYVFSFCISLIIPATYEDILRCYSTLVKSICHSLKYPDETIIIISGFFHANRSIITILKKSLKNCTKMLIIIIRTKKYNAASNRNFGYSHSHCPIVSYFDVDDIMSIYRILIIHNIFYENRKVDVVFHPSTRKYYKLDRMNLSAIYKKYVVTNQFSEITNKCKITFTFDGRIFKCDVSNGFFITNGWPSLKRYIMKNIIFNESLIATEDLDFISRIVVKEYKVSIFKIPLGYYIKDNSCKI